MTVHRLDARGHRQASWRILAGVLASVTSLAVVPAARASTVRVLQGPAVVVSPAPSSATALPQTQISILGIAPALIGAVTVTGSVSGPHPGKLEAYSTGTGASFVPKTPFTSGETVTVTTSLNVVGGTDGAFSFTVAYPIDVGPPQPNPVTIPNTAARTHFLSEPDLSAPIVTVKGNASSLGGDDLLLTPRGQIGATGPMILGPSGRLIYFRPIAHQAVMDLNAQTYEHQPVLTWWQGNVVDGHGAGTDFIVNDAYQTIAKVNAGNGLSADLHDFVLTGSNTAWITAYVPIQWDLTAMTGPAKGHVWDGVVQEIDVPTGLVMYQWNALNELPVTYTNYRAPAVAAPPLDWFHINSIEPLPGRQLLVSSRDTSAVYDVSIASGGKVLWTLGGKGNDFQLGSGVEFSLQHDAKLDGSSTLTMFDNQKAPSSSSALVIDLDIAAHTASLVNRYQHVPRLRDYTLGSTDLIANGDALISWGTSTLFTVENRAGKTVLTGRMPFSDSTYRTLAATWSATPAAPISVGTQRAAHRDVVVATSWDGATNVARWRILSGSSRDDLHSVADVADTGFETVTLIPPARYVAVQALSASGATERQSATFATAG